MALDYEDTIIPGIEPTISRKYDNGDTFVFTGDRAMAMADTPEAEAWRLQNPDKAMMNRYSPYDSIEEMHPIASKARDIIADFRDSPSGFVGRIMDKGILPGAAVGGTMGATGGAIAALLARLLLGKTSVRKWALAGGALGALLGGYSGHVRSTADRMSKSAATYMDPRNFILEKLQGAGDVSIGEKIKLADAVRSLDRSSAEKLASLVRSALGFGVGAIISKFIFGTNPAGTLLGGVLGALGTSIISNNLQQRAAAPTFDFNFRPLSYRDIL